MTGAVFSRILRLMVGRRTVSNHVRCRSLCVSGHASNVSNTAKYFLDEWHQRFIGEQIPEPLSSIKHILSSLINIPWEQVEQSDAILSESQMEKLERMCLCRLQRMPVQYIIGEWDFCGLTVHTRPPVFIPRPETEQLVSLVSEYLEKVSSSFQCRSLRALELCCGSGVISLALLNRQKNLVCVAADCSELACQLTADNAKLCALADRLYTVHADIYQSSCRQKLSDKLKSLEPPDLKHDARGLCQILVANPPYVSHKQMRNLAPEILYYEDAAALVGGSDGLVLVRHLLLTAADYLVNGGRMFLEVDLSHPPLIRDFVHQNFAKCRLRFIAAHSDFTGRERFVELEAVGDCP